MLFNCDPDLLDGQQGTAVCEVGTDGTGFRAIIGPEDGPGGAATNALRHPDYAPDGGIVFEADWYGEQIWRIPSSGGTAVRITDDFMRTLREGGEVRLWFTTPHERIEQAVPARRIWHTLVESAWASAEPGVLFWDTVLRDSTTQYNGMEVQGVNVCGEIPMEPYGACNLGSVNVAAFVRDPFTERANLDWNGLTEAVRLAVRFLDDVIDVGAPRHALKDQRRASMRSRRIGLGVLGMADCLAELNLAYGSGPSLSALDRLMGAIKEAAYGESIRLPAPRGGPGVQGGAPSLRAVSGAAWPVRPTSRDLRHRPQDRSRRAGTAPGDGPAARGPEHLVDGQPAPGDALVGSRCPVSEGLGIRLQGDHRVPGGNPRVGP